MAIPIPAFYCPPRGDGGVHAIVDVKNVMNHSIALYLLQGLVYIPFGVVLHHVIFHQDIPTLTFYSIGCYVVGSVFYGLFAIAFYHVSY